MFSSFSMMRSENISIENTPIRSLKSGPTSKKIYIYYIRFPLIHIISAKKHFLLGFLLLKAYYERWLEKNNCKNSKISLFYQLANILLYQ